VSDKSVTRKAPPGFTPDLWREFVKDGFVTIPDAIDHSDVKRYREAAEELASAYAHYDPEHAFRMANILPQHEAFRELVDHDRHVGFAYDLYGDQLQLVQSDLFIRPPGGVVNHWHIDGPRAVPYRVFSPHLPLKLRFGYWLTDLPESRMGNYVYVPGSHRESYEEEHSGNGFSSQQRVICGNAGTLSIAHANVWHRIDPNESDRTRITIFLTYAPSWLNGYYEYPKDWLEGLNREQRIIVRPYTDGENFIRPPRADLPLFADEYAPEAPSETDYHKIRRLTRYERSLKSVT
jgi:hypothetical protein